MGSRWRFRRERHSIAFIGGVRSGDFSTAGCSGVVPEPVLPNDYRQHRRAADIGPCR
ncbi:hypothetical protein KCP75_22315 [Salmonella enterica subsp. enterica]|nr:hypothetical protein KCP75_22315 [Salmonella enterica subsp. enterica]